jgi:hypothetical protein
MEVWAIIDGTNERYSVSTFGAVRANWSDVPQKQSAKRLRIEKTALLKPYLHTAGYWRVNLGRKNRHYVHRLVATAFVQNPDNKGFVDHIDGNRANNAVANLRWVTAKENTRYGGERHGFVAQTIAAKAAAFHYKRAEEYKKLLAAGLSLREISRRYGTSHSAIGRAVRQIG